MQFLILPTNSGGGMQISILSSKFQYMAPTIFAEKDFSRILSDINGYGHVFLLIGLGSGIGLY